MGKKNKSVSITEEIKTISKPTICLNMIVKNEAKNIVETLDNLSKYILFDYWVICDTGSTDTTKELITDWFKERDIKGELIDDEWKNFSHNRTRALQNAFGKTDYLLIWDADDRIRGEFKLPFTFEKSNTKPVPLFDMYSLRMGKDYTWERPLILNNKKKFKYVGVTHEYLEGDEPNISSAKIEGDYYIDAGTFGCRSQNPNKYYDDAITLEREFECEIIEEGKLAPRYAFYCAQSWRDTGKEEYIDNSITWYKKVLDLNGWLQEKFVACINLGNFYIKKSDVLMACKYWLKSLEYDAERIEGVVLTMDAYRIFDNHISVVLLYHKYKNYNRNIGANKLFIDKTKYNGLLEYNYSISAFYVKGEEKIGYVNCKKILRENLLHQVFLTSTENNLKIYETNKKKEIQ
jgi:hypothetical protein